MLLILSKHYISCKQLRNMFLSDIHTQTNCSLGCEAICKCGCCNM